MATSRELFQPLDGAKSDISLTIFSKYAENSGSVVQLIDLLVYRPCLFCLLIFMKYQHAIVSRDFTRYFGDRDNDSMTIAQP